MAASPALAATPEDDHRLADRYGILLLLLFVSLVLVSATGSSAVGRALSVLTLGGSTFVALAASGARRRLRRGVTIAVGALAVAAYAAGVTADEEAAAWGVVTATLSLLAIAAIVRRLASYRRIAMPAVLGAVSVYLFLGLTFAATYAVLGELGDGSFFRQVEEASVVDYLYFSVITLATVGFGDLTPASDLGRMLAASEGLMGQVYLVTIVAVLVSNLGRERDPGSRLPSNVADDMDDPAQE